MKKLSSLIFSFLLFALLLLPTGEIIPQASTYFSQAKISYEKNGTSPYEIRFLDNAQVKKESFFNYYKEFFNLDDNYEFSVVKEFTDNIGQTHYRFNQYYKGIELLETQFVLHEKNGYIYYANGHLVHGLNLDVIPSLSEQAALQYAINHIGAQSYMWENPEMEEFLKREQRNPSATFYPKGELKLTSGTEDMVAQNYKLVYRFDIYAENPVGRYYVDVNAKTGKIESVLDRIHDADVPGSGTSLYNGVVSMTVDEVNPGVEYRLQEHTTRPVSVETYNLNNTVNYGQAVDITSTTADGPWDPVGVNAHWGAEGTYDYYSINYGRNSYDDNGSPILSYVHYGGSYNNAFWDGERMTYGDGDGVTFTPLVSLDVCGHEVTHGVTEFSAGLIYRGESGALNESFSDIFGNEVEFMMIGAPGVGDGNWRIGEDITPDGLGIRNMANPNNFGDPDTYQGDGWANTDPNAGDNGGVHTNSGVQNFWYYLLVEGGSGVNDNGDSYSVTGLGFDDARKIAYRNLTVYLTPSSDYFDARLATINSAIDLFGANSPQLQSALDAWYAVGVYHPNVLQTVGVPADTLNFLAEVLVSTDTVDLVITNLGLEPLIINDLQIAGTHFTIDQMPALPLELTNYLDDFSISIIFTPTDPGYIVEELQITSNDPSNPVLPVYLNGKGFIINPAAEKVLYASSGPDNNGNILTVNTSTGEGTTLGWSNFEEIKSITIDPITGIMYGMTSTTQTTNILRVNGTEGDAYSLFTLDIPLAVSIAFDNNGELYSCSKLGDINKINLTDGTFEPVINTGSRVGAITFNPFNNELWATAGLGQNIDLVYKIDLNTGDTTQIGNTGFTAVTNDIAFDENGTLYGIIGWGSQPGQLIEINTTTGEGTLIGDIGFDNIMGLAYNAGNVSSVNDAEQLPIVFSLEQNYPNPFNPSTKIKYSIPASVNIDGGNVLVQLKVYNILGKEIATLVNEQQSVGTYEITFNAVGLPSGVYFYRIQAGSFVETKKMILMK